MIVSSVQQRGAASQRALGALIVFAVAFLAARPAVSQQSASADAAPPVGIPAALAAPVEGPPLLDGEVINDPSWADAVPLTGFWQTTPDEGQPASEWTEVRIVYTTDVLYVGVVCYDRDPGSIIVSDSRRDSSLEETDSFQIVLDTFLDEQNGFVFGTNPAGIEYDGQLVNAGQGNVGFGGGGGGGGRGGRGGGRRQQGGAGGGFNLNWDGSWDVRTQVSDEGWSAEFAIPFRTLRYPVGRAQTWGLNFQRNIRRRNETAFWAPLPRQFGLYRLSLAGRLSGLEVPGQSNLKVTPYVLGEALRGDVRRSDTTWLGDAGIDLKYSITPSLTLDATYNTDFAQVEVDEEQINLDRFSLFFPEKRPFFLENAGLFAVGNSGSAQIFFSRRIGIGPEGVVIPIRGGARLTGRVSGLTVGLLNMQTEAVGGLTPANNFSVVRVRRDLRNRSNVGAMFVGRQATGSLAGEDDYNRSFAVDGQLGIGQNGLLSGFAARTQTPGVEAEEYAFDTRAQYNSESWRLSLGYGEVADNFNPEVGFLRRRGFRRASTSVFHTYRPANFLRLHELRPHVTYNSFWNFDGFQETAFAHIDNHLEWKNGHEVRTGINLSREGVTEAFEIFPGVFVPPGTYDHREAELVGLTNQGAPVSFELRTVAGGFFGGDRVELTPSLRLRIGETFTTQLSLSRNDIDLPGGSFVTNLARARISYSFTPRIYVQSLIQYNDRADLWSTNFRFGWLQEANTGLFIVYNDTRGLGDVVPDGAGRSLTLKFTQLFDVLR